MKSEITLAQDRNESNSRDIPGSGRPLAYSNALLIRLATSAFDMCSYRTLDGWYIGAVPFVKITSTSSPVIVSVHRCMCGHHAQTVMSRERCRPSKVVNVRRQHTQPQDNKTHAVRPCTQWRYHSVDQPRVDRSVSLLARESVDRQCCTSRVRGTKRCMHAQAHMSSPALPWAHPPRAT